MTHADQNAPGKLTQDDPFYELIQQAYRVFKSPKPQTIGVCQGCCMDRKIEKDFFNPPIQDMPLSYVNDWFFAAADDPLPKEVWTYLLPRILEILACGEDVSMISLEVSLDRFPTGDQAEWTPAQWQVLDQFQRMYLARSMRAGENSLDTVLCMFANAGWPLGELLAQVLAVPPEVLVACLWRDWASWPGSSCIWITAFWNGADTATVFGFYTGEELYARLEAAVLDEASPELAEKALEVTTVIDAFRGR